MSVNTESVPTADASAFRHEALMYAGAEEFVDLTVPFIRAGVEAGEPVLVVVDRVKIDGLRDALGADARTVEFADMVDLGTNPARILPAWHEFVARHVAEGRSARGVGEPIWAGRSPAELIECQRHEALLNLAFADAPAWQLLCPYDTATLAQEVIAEARRSHAFVAEAGVELASREYRGVEDAPTRFDLPLPPPPTDPDALEFDVHTLEALRRFVATRARAAGLSPARVHDLVLAVNELATNSVLHGGGRGLCRVWPDDDVLVCEVHDGGRIADPLAGRTPPEPTSESGRGLWMVNQLCDLVQVRPADGNVVRVHLHRR